MCHYISHNPDSEDVTQDIQVAQVPQKRERIWLDARCRNI